MPTIAEIIAAKKAGPGPDAAKTSPSTVQKKTVDGIVYAKNSLNPEWTAQGPAGENLEATESTPAISRIDPPGKYQARVAAGLILSEQPANRSLSQATGEGIDMTPTAADAEATTWHQALNAYESDLVVLRDPATPEACWLACRPHRAGLPPILLHRLPWLLFEHPEQQSGPF